MPMKAAIANAMMPPASLIARANTAGFAARNNWSSKYRKRKVKRPAIRVGMANK
jgi:hypothetical protein